jgi:ubiquinone/menaquinone biosynthesis C-methylase UbiE
MPAAVDHHERGSADRRLHRGAAFGRYSREDARRYDAWYDTGAGLRMAAQEQALLDRLLQTRTENHTVLEVGCGTGHFTRWLSGRGLIAIGVDPVPAMLAVARERDPAGRYVQATAEWLPLPDASVDLVSFITALEFIERQGAALREAGRVARRGLLLGVLNLTSPVGLQRMLLARLRSSSSYRTARFLTPWRLARLVRRSLGARVDTVRWQTAIWPDQLPGWAHFRPFGAFIGMYVGFREPEEQR